MEKIREENDPVEAVCLWKLLLFKALLTLSYLPGTKRAGSEYTYLTEKA